MKIEHIAMYVNDLERTKDFFAVMQDGEVIGITGCPPVSKEKLQFGLFYQFCKSSRGHGNATIATKRLKKIFIAAQGKPEIYESDTKFNKMYQYILEPILQRFSYPEQKRRFLLSFYIHGIMGIVMEWMKGGCKEKISEISEMISEIVLPDAK